MSIGEKSRTNVRAVKPFPPYLLKIFLQIIDENLVFGHRYGLPRYFSFGKCPHHDRKRNGVYL